ncbi:MAG: NUDIX domain-containing protein, partial [Bacteroidota bacterium]
AIMDFGATHCRPRRPLCDHCTMRPHCVAFREKRIDQLPVKVKKIKRKTRFFNFLVLDHEDTVYLQKREAKDIWRLLYQFPLIESKQLLNAKELVQHSEFQHLLNESSYQIDRVSKPFQQQLTHQTIKAKFWEIRLQKALSTKKECYNLVNRKNLNKFAFPKMIDLYLQDKSLYLDLR